MKITWLGHACFCVESDAYRILLDPYGRVEGYPELKTAVHAVYCSHGHQDHCNQDAAELLSARKNPFAVTEYKSFHDDQHGALRGENTIRIFEAEGLRVAHLGDLGHQPDKALCAALRAVDVLLLPVGGYYTIDAQQAAELVRMLKPAVAVPMHYHHEPYGLPNVDGVEPFLTAFDLSKVIRLEGNSFTVGEFAAGSIVVPKYCGGKLQ